MRQDLQLGISNLLKLTCLVWSFLTSIIGWIDTDHSLWTALFFSHSLQISALPVEIFSLCSVSVLQNSLEWATFWYAQFRGDIKCSTGLGQLCLRDSCVRGNKKRIFYKFTLCHIFTTQSRQHSQYKDTD